MTRVPWISPAEKRALRAVCVFSEKKVPHDGSKLDTKALHKLEVRGWVQPVGEKHWKATLRGFWAREVYRTP